VGKLAAEHLVEEFDGDVVRRIHSEHFPPQVTVDESSVASLAAAEVYAVDAAGRDLLVLVGDFQAGDAVGQHRVAEAFLDVAESFGTSEVIALGGAPTGEVVEEYSVVGALTDSDRRADFEDAGVEFRESEPTGGIVGTSGLLLGLAPRRDLPAACLMGETSGYMVDPLSAQALLEVLERHLGFQVDFGKLEDRAEELEAVIQEFQESQGGGMEQTPSEEDLRYIG
jgi:uncharacterized protein (TIGR00162 family)